MVKRGGGQKKLPSGGPSRPTPSVDASPWRVHEGHSTDPTSHGSRFELRRVVSGWFDSLTCWCHYGDCSNLSWGLPAPINVLYCLCCCMCAFRKPPSSEARVRASLNQKTSPANSVHCYFAPAASCFGRLTLRWIMGAAHSPCVCLSFGGLTDG